MIHTTKPANSTKETTRDISLDSNAEPTVNNTKVTDIGLTSWIGNTSNPSFNKSVYYYVSVKNNGPQNATGLKVHIPIPTGTHYANCWVSWDNGTTWKAAVNLPTGTYNNTMGMWTIGTFNTTNGILPNQNSVLFNLRVIVDDVNRWLNFEASKYWQDQEDWITSNDNTSASIHTIP